MSAVTDNDYDRAPDHLRGASVGVWPLNVFSSEDAAADLHNLVFRSDYRIVPATTRNRI